MENTIHRVPEPSSKHPPTNNPHPSGQPEPEPEPGPHPEPHSERLLSSKR